MAAFAGAKTAPALAGRARIASRVETAATGKAAETPAASAEAMARARGALPATDGMAGIGPRAEIVAAVTGARGPRAAIVVSGAASLQTASVVSAASGVRTSRAVIGPVRRVVVIVAEIRSHPRGAASVNGSRAATTLSLAPVAADAAVGAAAEIPGALVDPALAAALVAVTRARARAPGPAAVSRAAASPAANLVAANLAAPGLAEARVAQAGRGPRPPRKDSDS